MREREEYFVCDFEREREREREREPAKTQKMRTVLLIEIISFFHLVYLCEVCVSVSSKIWAKPVWPHGLSLSRSREREKTYLNNPSDCRH